jgi:hypothetical protein
MQLSQAFAGCMPIDAGSGAGVLIAKIAENPVPPH